MANNPEIAGIAQVIANPAAPIDTVITYNFDDVLETTLSRPPFSVSHDVIFSGDDVARSNHKLRIYHPHGYLPYGLDKKLLEHRVCVFAEPQYHAQYYDSHKWENVIQLRTFLEKRCLFVGLSFDDPNHRRLVEFAKHQGSRAERHVSIQISWQKPGVDRKSDLLNRLREDDLRELGIATVWVESPKEIGPLLASLI